MKKFSIITIILCLIMQIMCFNVSASGDTIYVSPTGNDLTGAGTYDNPYLTMAKAKSVVREVSKDNGDINVIFMPGQYQLKNISFTADDSGSENGKVVYKSYDKNNKAVFTSAVDVSLSLFNHVTDYEVLKKLPYNARANVLCLDLSAVGINGSLSSDYYPQLYVNNEAQFIAKYPNSGYLTADNADGTESFVCQDDLLERSKRWIGVKGAQIDGSVNAVYAWNKLDVLSVDENGAITVDGTVRKTAEYYITNLIEELDVAGEYYVDMESNMLYYYPHENFSTSKISIDGYDSEKVISLTNTSYVSFEDLSFERMGKRVIYGTGLKDVDVRGCNFINIQSGDGVNCYAIDVEGYDIDVDSNYAYMCKDNFIRFNGGNLEGFVYGKINVTNNRIFACGFENGHLIIRSDDNYTSISKNIGNNVSNNVISDCTAFAAISVPGNNTTVHNNEIYNFGRDYNDAGAIYFGKSNLKYGNMVMYNYIHDLNKENEYAAIYSDDGYGGLTVKNNVMKDARRPFTIGMGMNNDFSDNLFVNCSEGMVMGTRMTDTWDKTSGNGQPGTLTALTNEAKDTFGIWGSSTSKPYKDTLLEKYPDMKNFDSRTPYFAPWNSVVIGNVSVGAAPAVNSTLSHEAASVWDETEKAVEGYKEALFTGAYNLSYVDELMLYGPSDVKAINGKAAANPQLSYQGAYFNDAANQDYTPSSELIDTATAEYANTGIKNIDLTDLGISDEAKEINGSLAYKLESVNVYEPVVSDSGKTSILWERANNASYYTVKISENEKMTDCYKKIVYEQGNFCAADFELDIEKTYYMTVSAVSLGKETSETITSDVITFNTADFSDDNLAYAASFLKDRIDGVENRTLSYTDPTAYEKVTKANEEATVLMSTGTADDKNAYVDTIYDVLSETDEYLEDCAVITKAELSGNNDTVTVSGIGLKPNSLISVLVTTPCNTKETASEDKSTKSIRYMNFVSTDNKGNFSFDFPTAKLSEIEYEGEFTVYAVDADGYEVSKTYSFGSFETGAVSYYDENGVEILKDNLNEFNNKTVTVKLPVINRTKTVYTPSFIITSNSGGLIKNVNYSDTLSLASESSGELSCDIIYNSDYTYEFMLWESFGVMKPLTKKALID